MTRLQKRVYLLVLRALAVLLYHRLHVDHSDMTVAGDQLRGDLTDKNPPQATPLQRQWLGEFLGRL